MDKNGSIVDKIGHFLNVKHIINEAHPGILWLKLGTIKALSFTLYSCVKKRMNVYQKGHV